MKIGILTQSMAANYGCHLQAYALQIVLERMGHSVVILDRWDKPKHKAVVSKMAEWFIRFLKDCVKICLGRPVFHNIEMSHQPYFWQNFQSFQKDYLHLSQRLYSTEELLAYARLTNIDAFIVGSDQVWRPAHNHGEKLFNMFLDFTKGQEVIRVAYAASFGVDKWEFTKHQTQICKELVASFNAVSVRENTGVDLCKKYFGIDAKHVLDPTLLLDSNDYETIIQKEGAKYINGGLFCYILDASIEAKDAIKRASEITGLMSYVCLPLIPESTFNPFKKKDCILPPISQWLMSFKKADMVLVDSFHGMVFSIIYNKPFWVVGNLQRGLSRFTSLLEMLGLKARMITYDKINETDLFEPIDWERVNFLISTNKRKSINFLEKGLKGENSPN